MIRSFRGKDAERIFNYERPKRVPSDLVRRVQRKLRMLHNANTINDLNAPSSNRLEALKGDRRGQHSIRINDRWRVCFRWDGGNAYDVDIVDYH